MSDDLAEAIKRYRNPWATGYFADSLHRDAVTIANHYLSTLTAPTPVTVEGLKGLGFEEDYSGAYVFRQGDESIMCSPIGADLKYPVWYLTGSVLTPGHKPQNMNDVKCLVSRLSRPKPQ